MKEEEFLDSLEDLHGKMAIVTGGAAGIGLETTIYLARRGCTVYVASRNRDKSLKGIEAAPTRLAGSDGVGEIKFHQCDLSSIKGAKESAVEFGKLEGRLDILVCNAGISMAAMDALSADGYDRAFATNHLGHFVFVTSLLDLIERTASQHSEARIVMVSSSGHQMASKLDYSALSTRIPADGTSIRGLKPAFVRYGQSKLANIYFAAELARRLRARGINNVYCNSCHPGVVPNTGLGGGEKNYGVGPLAEKVLRGSLGLFANSNEDSAKTQVFLAAGREIAERGVSGEYWAPRWSWGRAYKGCGDGGATALARDEGEQGRLWEFSERAVAKAFDESTDLVV